MTDILEKIGKILVNHAEKKQLKKEVNERKIFEDKLIRGYLEHNTNIFNRITMKDFELYPHRIYSDFVFWYCNLNMNDINIYAECERDKIPLDKFNPWYHDVNRKALFSMDVIEKILPYVFQGTFGDGFTISRYYSDKKKGVAYLLGNYFSNHYRGTLEKSIFQSATLVEGIQCIDWKVSKEQKDVYGLVERIQKDEVLKNEFNRKESSDYKSDARFAGLSGLLRYTQKCASDKFNTLSKNNKREFASKKEYIDKKVSEDYKEYADILYAGKSAKFKEALKPYALHATKINPLWDLDDSKRI